MTISIRCDGCSATYNVPDEMAGKKAKCTKCGQLLTVAAPNKAMQPAASGKIEAACRQCGAKYAVGIAMAGKRAKCTKCGGVFEVPDPNATPLVEVDPIMAVVADDPFAGAGGGDWSDPLGDAIGMASNTMPLARPGAGRPAGKTSARKGVPAIVWIAAGGGGAALLLLLLLVLFLFSGSGGDDDGGEVATNGGTSSGSGTSPSSTASNSGGKDSGNKNSGGEDSGGTQAAEVLPEINDAVAWTWQADLPVAGPADLARQPLKLFDRPSDIFFADGDVAQATISYRRSAGGKTDVLIQRLDLKTGQTLAEQAFAQNTKLLDLSRDGTTLLILPGAAYATHKTLQVWRWSDKEARQIGEWSPYKDKGISRFAWSMMIDADRIATGHSQEKVAIIWDASGQQVSRFPHEGNAQPRLTPGGKYLVQHSGIWLRFFESSTLQHVGSIGPLSADYLSFQAVTYRPDGKAIGATFQISGGSAFVAWSAADRQQQTAFEIPRLSSPLAWHGDDDVMAGAYLLSLSNEMPVWQYVGLYPLAQTIDRRVWHHLSAGREQYLAAVSVPSAEVRSNIEKYVAANVPILQKGDTVGLQVQINGATPNPDLQQDLTETATSRLKVAGYSVGDGQPFRLRVTLEDKDTGRQLEYRTMGLGTGAETINVPERRINCEVAFVDSSDKVVWRTNTTIGPSGISFTRGGEGDFVKNLLDSRWTTFDKWIQNVRIAELVRKHSSTGDFGSSMLQADGERMVKVPVN